MHQGKEKTYLCRLDLYVAYLVDEKTIIGSKLLDDFALQIGAF